MKFDLDQCQICGQKVSKESERIARMEVRDREGRLLSTRQRRACKPCATLILRRVALYLEC
jgi:hypothetical protein